MVIFSYMYGIKYQILNKYQPPPPLCHPPGDMRAHVQGQIVCFVVGGSNGGRGL